MASAYDTMINPVTGRSYGEEMATATGNVGGTWNPTSFFQPKDTTPAKDPGYLAMRQQVAQGADLSPYQQRLQGLLNDPSSIQNDPPYQFRLQQGNQLINRSAAAKGMLGFGNVLAELAKYGQGMASEEYGDQINRLSDLMRGSQQFGLASKYYAEPARTTSGWEGGGYVTRRNENPTYW